MSEDDWGSRKFYLFLFVLCLLGLPFVYANLTTFGGDDVGALSGLGVLVLAMVVMLVAYFGSSKTVDRFSQTITALSSLFYCMSGPLYWFYKRPLEEGAQISYLQIPIIGFFGLFSLGALSYLIFTFLESRKSKAPFFFLLDSRRSTHGLRTFEGPARLYIPVDRRFNRPLLFFAISAIVVVLIKGRMGK